MPEEPSVGYRWVEFSLEVLNTVIRLVWVILIAITLNWVCCGGLHSSIQELKSITRCE